MAKTQVELTPEEQSVAKIEGLEAQITALKAENDKLKEASSQNEKAKSDFEKLSNDLTALKSENEKLSEQVTAFQAGSETDSLIKADLVKAQKELSEAKAESEAKDKQLEKLEAGLEIEKGLASLVFDLDSVEANDNKKEFVIFSFEKQFKTIKKDGVLMTIDKKTQEETGKTLSASIFEFAEPYAIKKQDGVGMATQLKAGSVDLTDITYADKNSSNAQRNEAYTKAYHAKINELEAKDIRLGTPEYIKAMQDAKLLP